MWREAEKKRLEELAERRRYEDERDARLLRMVREEVLRGEEKEDVGIVAKKVKKVVKVIRTNERGETPDEEKERLRGMIAVGETEEAEFEDDELLRLRHRAAGLSLNDKRKWGKEMAVGDSPPMTTPMKGQRTGLCIGAKTWISETRSEGGAVAGSSASILEPLGKISLSLKHVTAGTGPGARERYENECREIFEALTVDELKDACKAEHVVYGKREMAINRLVKRRVVKAYDPVNVPLPETPGVVRRSGRNICLVETDSGKDDEEASE
ncbi:hypothetical protein CBR_g27859 [Chara braunii]|uniref:Uncharacterized protein n=1 Tax=Chara braunii TaxID=69332 RepID=A0A388L8X1_CHABU|nr:hypothetical protein CBR_g27859 [Chara braunii]|eukprot:GBG78633.1 hypothetical protein CBR_g27859 [Chara braunii]